MDDRQENTVSKNEIQIEIKDEQEIALNRNENQQEIKNEQEEPLKHCEIQLNIKDEQSIQGKALFKNEANFELEDKKEENPLNKSEIHHEIENEREIPLNKSEIQYESKEEQEKSLDNNIIQSDIENEKILYKDETCFELEDEQENSMNKNEIQHEVENGQEIPMNNNEIQYELKKEEEKSLDDNEIQLDIEDDQNIQEKTLYKSETHLELDDGKEDKSLNKKQLKSKKKLQKRSKSQIQLEKLKKKYLNPVDIKYRGPLSYRYLRIISWTSLAFGQFSLFNSICVNTFKTKLINDTFQVIFSLLSGLSTPLFIIVSFGLILSGRKSFKYFLLFYGLSYLGLGLSFVMFYMRYINGLFAKLGAGTKFLDIVKTFCINKADVNTFADLFLYVLFHYFINYNPKKHFLGKKIIIFRLFSLLPVTIVIISFILKIKMALSKLNLPFFIFPFLTTKSPLVFTLFVVLSFWIKYRKRIFMKMGASEEDYSHYLTTNRNSLSFSTHLSAIICIYAVIDFFLLFFLVIIYIVLRDETQDTFDYIIKSYGVGECLSLLLCIPFILLYSYTKQHSNSAIDIFINIFGLGMIVL
eukprot:jgi/Orpsp1_1/1191285/evm.model.d7180000084688.1